MAKNSETAAAEATAVVRNKGGRPKGSKTKRKAKAAPVVSMALLSDPAVQNLIDAAVAQKFDALLAKLGEGREAAGTVGAADEGSDLRLIRQLASAITEIGDQGSKKVRVAPEEMAERREARERMEALILDYRAKGEVASYDLSRTVYLDEVLVAPTYVDSNHVQKVQRVEWAGAPDESMTPVNEAAKAIHAAYMRSIGGRTKTEKVPYTRATANPNLRVVSEQNRPQEAPQVGRGQGQESNLHVIRPNQPGQVKETHVLGTRAAPARQIA